MAQTRNAGRSANADRPLPLDETEVVGDVVADDLDDLAPSRMTTAQIAELVGEGTPFAITWLAGTPNTITYSRTNKEGEVMEGEIRQMNSNNRMVGEMIPVAFTGAAVVRTLTSVCKGEPLTRPFVVRLVKVESKTKGFSPMWQLVGRRASQ